MNFKNIVVIFLILIILNKIAGYLLKLFSLSVYSDIKAKGLMNVNLLNSMNKEEFFSKVTLYLEYKNYRDIEILEENIWICYAGENAFGVFIKKLDITQDVLEVKEVLRFISKLNELNLKKSIIITNGVIGDNIYKLATVIKDKNIDIICINGVELAYEIRNLTIEGYDEEIII
ncbi:hypothetical protein SAMN02745163_00855 [Clostridium cavendishii DSM 21758]|uniref:Restriction endonuclease n=1 Tax=Clostridium cavendishii DSM 21758 TaxID=1121302 RepID=A0A1M6EHG3_9CLOT|nr:hypothetical protein [Clostridium cavendishii]SHI84914.1 hypothetical protein SAMN02745163_00855 [Clostridium cavendishii DSM 21758]